MTTLEPEPNPPELTLNNIGEIRLNTSAPLVFDGYAANRLTGSFILVEPGTNATVGADLLLPPTEVAKPEYSDFAI
jgi:bifunctional enzyme CysN/CysC/sulfate adenylyltransferase subunit 1